MPGGVRIRLLVQPRARRNRIEGLMANARGGLDVKLAVTAAPEGGKANQAVLELLSTEWGVAKSALEIVMGATDRRKVVELAGWPTELMAKLSRWIDGLEAANEPRG